MTRFRLLLPALAVACSLTAWSAAMADDAAPAAPAAPVTIAPAPTTPAPETAAPPPAPAAVTSERAIGAATAPVTVTEYYSLTCPHCARFAADTFPKIKAELIDTGKLRYVFADYPLDKPALLAAQIARTLPPDRYEPFVLALLGSQRRWAYDTDSDPHQQLARMASLAGLSRPQFDAAANDTALRDAILAGVDTATQHYGVDSTPTFIFNGPKAHDRKEAGELSWAEFSAIVTEVAGP